MVGLMVMQSIVRYLPALVLTLTGRKPLAGKRAYIRPLRRRSLKNDQMVQDWY